MIFQLPNWVRALTVSLSGGLAVLVFLACVYAIRLVVTDFSPIDFHRDVKNYVRTGVPTALTVALILLLLLLSLPQRYSFFLFLMHLFWIVSPVVSIIWVIDRQAREMQPGIIERTFLACSAALIGFSTIVIAKRAMLHLKEGDR